MRYLSLASILFFLCGCATEQKLNFISTPSGADVYAKPIGQGKRILIGQTPLEIVPDQVEIESGGYGPVYVEFIKEGYQPFRVYVTEVLKIQTTINADMVPATGLENEEAINRVVGMLFESQRLTKIKRYDQALKLLDQAEIEAPFVSSIHEMKGGIFFIKKKYRDAYDSYDKAVRLDPKNSDARQVLGVLKRNFGRHENDDPMDIRAKRLPAGESK